MGPVNGNAIFTSALSLSLRWISLVSVLAPASVAATCIDYGEFVRWAGIVTDPSLTSDTQEIAISGDYLYAAASNDGFSVWDITNPDVPAFVTALPLGGDIGASPQAVAIRDNYAFVAASPGDSLFVVDISNPLAPTRAAAVATPFGAYYVALSGDYAFVTAGSNGSASYYHVIDISPPTAPTIAASRTTYGVATYYVQTLGNYAYFEAGAAGVAVVDITDPRNPVNVTSVDTPGGPDDLFISGSHLYIADFCGGLQIMDLVNPAAPALVGGVDEYGCMDGVRVVGNNAFLIETGGGLLVYDVSDPAAPAYVAKFPAAGCPDCIAATETHAYVGSCKGGIEVYALGNQAAPEPLATIGSDDEGTDVVMAGTYAYLADYNGGLIIYDVSPPTAPLRRGSTVQGICQANGIAIQDALVYLTDRCGLKIFDVSDPFAPDSVGSLDLGYYAAGLAVDGTYAYVAVYNDGLQIVDISDPSAPTAAGSVPIVGYSNAVALHGAYAIVAAQSGGLVVVDVSDPMSPTIVGGATTYEAFGVAVQGNIAYEADGGGGLTTVDLTDPASPTVLASSLLPREARDVAVSGSLAYVSGGDHGVWVFDVSDPAAPRAVGSAPAAGGGAADYSLGLAVEGDVVCVASIQGGLMLLPAQCTDTTGPDLTIGVLQNPVITNSTDIYVSASEALTAAPAVTAGGASLAMEEVTGGDAPLFRGRYALSGAGTIAISAAAADAFGNETLSEYLFVSFPVGRAGGRAVSADGALEIRVPANALAREVFLTIAAEGGIGAPGPTYEVQPYGMEIPGLEARFDVGSLPELGDLPRLQVQIENGGAWQAVPTYFRDEDRSVHATLGGTGRLRLGESGGAGSMPLPARFSLRPGSPNPFAGSTEIAYELPRAGSIALEILDVTGRRVRTLARGTAPQGIHRATWDGRDDAGRPLAPGIYLALLVHPGGTEAQKLVTLR